MTQLLLSNYRPLRAAGASYKETFDKLLGSATSVSIASGYVSEDAMVFLREFVEYNGAASPDITVCTGMHKFEGMTQAQLDASLDLHHALQAHGKGEVTVVHAFKYHGKAAHFKFPGGSKAIVGSSNLSAITGTVRQYETDVLLSDKDSVVGVEQFLADLNANASRPIDQANVPLVQSHVGILDGYLGVTRASPADISFAASNLSPITFELPLKTEPRSNLNASFAVPRASPNGRKIPRPWYESELIVPVNIRRLDGFPRGGRDTTSGIIKVMTDDGWEFSCRVSGGNKDDDLQNKNFRSFDDLKILGRWIKGRMLASGAIRAGQQIGPADLIRYGRETLTLTKISGSDKWLLSLEVPNK